MTFKTFNEIVDDAFTNLDEESITFLKACEKDQLISMHHWYGRHIRNHYELWNPENPLTMVDYVPEINEDGADASARHPDQMSMSIIERLWQRAKLAN